MPALKLEMRITDSTHIG